MTTKQLNRDYFIRVRGTLCGVRINRLVGLGTLTELFGADLTCRILRKCEVVASDSFTCRPKHGFEVTFISH